MDIERIQELVIDERYREAFEALPDDVRQMARTVQQQVREAIGDVFQTEPDRYKLEIINALSANRFQQAATLLAAHPDNTPKKVEPETVQKPIRPSPEAIRAAPRRPSYFPRAIDMRSFHDIESDFPPSCQRLANEVFSGRDMRLETWLLNMTNFHQVPSARGIEFFVDLKIQGLKQKAEQKLRARPPEPLNAYESNAHYYPEAYRQELIRENRELLQERSFGNLIEYVIVELFDALRKYEPYKSDIQRVLKSSPEEDLFRKSDLVIELKTGQWVSVDITTAQSEKTLERKKEMLGRSRYVRLPNLEVMLQKKGELDNRESCMAVRALGEVDPELFRDFTVRRMNALKAGDTRSVVDIFRESTAALKKNADRELSQLMRIATG